MIGNKEVLRQMKVDDGVWTVMEVRDLLTPELMSYHANFPEERCDAFYRRVAELQNLTEKQAWSLNSPGFRKNFCGFYLQTRGRTGVTRIFGILLDVMLPYQVLMNRNREKVDDLSRDSNPPRVFVKITAEEAIQLERRHGCAFWGLSEDQVYYDIPSDIAALLPVLEFAYNKHRRH